MRLGIMQPYFFPYLGHFSLIASVDKWIVFDVSQYTPKSWMTRNRVLHPTEGWNYISVPLKRSSTSLKTYQAEINDIKSCEQNLLGKLSHYKKQAPFYNNVIKLVKSVFQQQSSSSLVELNILSIAAVCKYLDIPFNVKRCSALNLSFPSNMLPGDWAPTICEHLNAKEYLNPETGIHLFKQNKFAAINTTLYSHHFLTYKYATGTHQFETSLSILDVLMWLPASEVKQSILDNTKIQPIFIKEGY